jgi:hypothetical protein
MSSFDVDTRAITKWAAKAKGQAPRMLAEELKSGFHRAGHRLRIAANKHINRWTGELEGSATVTTTQSGTTTETVVAWTAPYAKWVDQGRGPIEARPGSVLRFETRSGEVVFTKRVGPAPAQRFAAKGLADARAGIRSDIQDAARQFVRRFEAAA